MKILQLFLIALITSLFAFGCSDNVMAPVFPLSKHRINVWYIVYGQDSLVYKNIQTTFGWSIYPVYDMNNPFKKHSEIVFVNRKTSTLIGNMFNIQGYDTLYCSIGDTVYSYLEIKAYNKGWVTIGTGVDGSNTPHNDVWIHPIKETNGMWIERVNITYVIGE